MLCKISVTQGKLVGMTALKQTAKENTMDRCNCLILTLDFVYVDAI